MYRWLLVIILVAPVAHAMSIAELACGATICLAGDGGDACAPYLDKYYSIDGPTKGATKRMRKIFLAQCKKEEPPASPEIVVEAPDYSQIENDMEKHYGELFNKMRHEGSAGLDSNDPGSP